MNSQADKNVVIVVVVQFAVPLQFAATNLNISLCNSPVSWLFWTGKELLWAIPSMTLLISAWHTIGQAR